MSRTLVLVSCATFAAIFGHQILFSVVPLYVDDLGGGSTGAGAANGLYMFATVLTQIQMPRILPRFGYRAMLVFGMLLLGAPTLLYGVAGSLTPILALSLLRGIGFGMVTVVVFAVIAEITPPGRLGEALGIVLVFTTVPTVFCGALGLWMAQNVGFLSVFLLGTALPLFGFLCALGIGAAPQPAGGSTAGFFAGLSRGPLLRVMLVFASVTVSAGMVLTFLPISASGPGLFSATGALLFFAGSTTFFRWWAGRMSDRYGSFILLVPGLLLAAVGVWSLSADGVWLLVGAVVFGAGFGILQNATLLMMMERVEKGEYGLGSTLWNVAFDAGSGAGAFAFGFVIPYTGFPLAYALCAGLLVCTVFVVSLDGSRTKETA